MTDTSVPKIDQDHKKLETAKDNNMQKQEPTGLESDASAKEAPTSSQSSASLTATQTSTAEKTVLKPTVVKPIAKEPQTKKIDITIADGNYSIFCPVHEEEELRLAVSYINNYALDLKKAAPNIRQENLLVLCCLDLYEKIHSNDKANETRRNEDKKSEDLLHKIIKDAQSVL